MLKFLDLAKIHPLSSGQLSFWPSVASYVEKVAQMVTVTKKCSIHGRGLSKSKRNLFHFTCGKYALFSLWLGLEKRSNQQCETDGGPLMCLCYSFKDKK